MKPKKSSEQTKANILLAARRLFAEQGIAEVSIRDIAKAAGVSHGLVQQYFGTRSQMIAAIIQNEIEQFRKDIPPGPTGSAGGAGVEIEAIRTGLKAGWPRFREFATLIMRAQLAGFAPENLLDPATRTPAMALVGTIEGLQKASASPAGGMDARMVSACMNASLFAFATMAPWLMASVGLKPEEFEARFEEVVDIFMNVIHLAAGASGHAPGLSRQGRKAR